jgi:hypothetical protein
MASLVLTGDTSGQVTLAAPAVAGTTTLTLPATTGTVLNDATCGVCRAWVNYKGTATRAINGSFNVSSVTFTATGDYTVNFTNAITDANYAVVGGGSRTVVNMLCITVRNFATTSVRLTPIDSANAQVDADITTIAVFR